MIVYTSKKEKIELSEQPFASGGEGAVYKVISAPTHLQDSCVKIYHSQTLREQRAARIKFMVKNPPEAIRGEGFMLGWPEEYVCDESGNFLGFVMPMGFPGSKELVVLTPINLSKKLDQKWHDRYDRTLGKKALLNRLKLICNIAIPVHILHSTGRYVLKDFKPQNVLATADGRITMVDMDSIQIVDDDVALNSDGSAHFHLLYEGTAATPDYMPPEYFTKNVGREHDDVIRPSWDSFAIGVVFYQLLFGIHPYVVTPKRDSETGSNEISQNIAAGLFPFGDNGDMVKIRPRLHNKFMLLPEPLQALFTRTFCDDADNRPSAEEWGKYIHDVVVDASEEEKAVEEGKTKEGKVSVEAEKTLPLIVDAEKKGDTSSKKKKGTNKAWWVLLTLTVIALIGLAINSINTHKEEDPYFFNPDTMVNVDTAYAPPEAANSSDQVDQAAQPADEYDDGTITEDGIVFKTTTPTKEDIDEWKLQYASDCTRMIEEYGAGFDIPTSFKEKDPCLVWLILKSKSLNSDKEKQNWFDLYSLMNDEQIDKLYDILYREIGKLGKIEKDYQNKQKEIERKREEILEKYN